MGVSATFGRARIEEIAHEDIPDLQARRDELKNAVKQRMEEWMSLETEIVENRLEADRWQGLLDEICEMLAGSHAPEAIWTVIGIEAVKKRLRTIPGRNQRFRPLLFKASAQGYADVRKHGSDPQSAAPTEGAGAPKRERASQRVGPSLYRVVILRAAA